MATAQHSAITTTDVYRHLKKDDPGSDPDGDHMALVVESVNAQVDVWHGQPWPAGVKYGAIMFAARLYRRRNSVNGVEAFSDMGASYVSRFDADLDRQLLINAWTPPRIG